MKPEVAVKQEAASAQPNLEKMCRLCLAYDHGTIDIFEPNQKFNIPMRMMACTALEAQTFDALPKRICHDCRVQLERSYYFRKRSQLADAKLRKHIRLVNAGKVSRVFQVIKSEDDDDDDEDELSDTLEFLKEVDNAAKEKLCHDRVELEENLFEKFRQEETDRIFEEAKHFFNTRISKKGTKKMVKVETMKRSESPKETKLLKSSYIFENVSDPPSEVYSGDAESFEDAYYLFKAVADEEQVENNDDRTEAGDTEEYTLVNVDEDKDDQIVLEGIDFQNDVDSSDAHDVHENYNEDSSSMIDEISDNSNTHVMYSTQDTLESQDDKETEDVEIVDSPEELMEGDDDLGSSETMMQIEQHDRTGSDDLIETNISTNNEELKIFKCLECPQAFTRRAQLLRHSSVHERVRGYQCEHCKKWFACKSSLDRHARVHTGEKPFKCEICHRHFIQKEILKRHMSIHTGDKPYGCPICEKKFVQKQMLSSHINLKHTENPIVQMHECFLCPKSFCHASGLSRHLLIHSGVSYTCKVCFKNFSDKSAVKRHTTSVHN